MTVRTSPRPSTLSTSHGHFDGLPLSGETVKIIDDEAQSRAPKSSDVPSELRPGATT